LGTASVLGGIYGNIGNKANTDLANTTTTAGLNMAGSNIGQYSPVLQSILRS